VAIAEGWMDASLPLMEQVYEASTLDTASERERLTGALEEAANEFLFQIAIAERGKLLGKFFNDLFHRPFGDGAFVDFVALEEAANEFRRYSKRYAAGAQKETAAIFDLYSHLLSDARLRRAGIHPAFGNRHPG
jgi:phosphotransferase system enzyme I (PtsP)